MATIRGEFSGLWYVFIGMFLFSAAKMGYENILIKDALNGVLVRDVMSMHVHTIDTSLTLDKVVEDYVFKYHHSSFPVIEGDKVKGMLVAGLIRNIPRDKWHVTPVSQCLEPIRREQIVSSREKVSNVLGKLLEHEITHLLVMENEKLVGIVTRIDIMKLLKFKMEFGG
jgi:predicted transcriptional regulator